MSDTKDPSPLSGFVPEGLPIAGNLSLHGQSDPLEVRKVDGRKILPGEIQVAGATTLADWRSSSDSTVIAGGMITASSLEITDFSLKPDGTRDTAAEQLIVTGRIQADFSPSPIAGHVQGLPVAGYAKNVEQWKVDMVNENKILEEKVLRRVDAHVRNRDSQEIDQASVQLARRHFEDAFYRLNRAIMQPKRILGDLA